MITAEVKFAVEFDEDNIPSSYTNIEHLTEIIQEAVEDAMFDIGADVSGVPRVEIDNS